MPDNKSAPPMYPQVPSSGGHHVAPGHGGQQPLRGPSQPAVSAGGPQYSGMMNPQASGYSQPPYQIPSVAPVKNQPPDAFFGALFDLSFTKYITVTFAKVIYVLTIAFVALSTFLTLYVIKEMYEDAFYVSFLPVIIGAFVSIVFARVNLECKVALVRAAQYTASIDARVAEKTGSGS